MNEVAQVGTDPAGGTRTPKGAHTVKSDYFGSVGGGGGVANGGWIQDLRELQGQSSLPTCPTWSHFMYEVC